MILALAAHWPWLGLLAFALIRPALDFAQAESDIRRKLEER